MPKNNKEAVQEFDMRCTQLMQLMKKWNAPIYLTDGFRSLQEQADLYALGRTKPGKIVTKAKPGSSAHNYGLARDYCFLLPHGKITYTGDWNLLGKACKQVGLSWGGSWLRFKDRPHCEFPNWKKFKK